MSLLYPSCVQQTIPTLPSFKIYSLDLFFLHLFQPTSKSHSPSITPRIFKPFFPCSNLHRCSPFSKTTSPKRHFQHSVRCSNKDMESAENNPGLVERPDEETKSFIMQQTMYRIKDPKASLEFYSKVLGMRLLKRFDYPQAKFSLYFMGYEDANEVPSCEEERVKWTFTRRGTLELTHNWGTESDPEFKGYHNGNTEPRGWGHIGITVDDVYKACERFEKLNVQFVKKPNEGRMKGLAFIKDPDGYWIEILDVKHMLQINA